MSFLKFSTELDIVYEDENVIIVNCKVPSEAYQILSMLRQDSDNKNYAVSQAAVVKKADGKISLEDGFIGGNPVKSHGWNGSLIGSLVGILGGPLGVLMGGMSGALIGDTVDLTLMEGKSLLLERASECLADGETALLLMIEEKSENAIEEKLQDFQICITRLDAAEIAAEIEEVLRKWKTVAYPTTWAWLQSCAQCVYDPGYLRNPWGRLKVAKIYKGERRADLERQFSNFPIQSTVADTVQIAMDKMRQYRDNTGLEFILQNQIHDAVMVECPLENVPAVKEMFHATMAAIDIPIPGSSKSFRLGVDIDVYERWGKKMKT
jgi:uncharacterized membrane protein